MQMRSFSFGSNSLHLGRNAHLLRLGSAMHAGTSIAIARETAAHRHGPFALLGEDEGLCEPSSVQQRSHNRGSSLLASDRKATQFSANCFSKSRFGCMQSDRVRARMERRDSCTVPRILPAARSRDHPDSMAGQKAPSQDSRGSLLAVRHRPLGKEVDRLLSSCVRYFTYYIST